MSQNSKLQNITTKAMIKRCKYSWEKCNLINYSWPIYTFNFFKLKLCRPTYNI